MDLTILCGEVLSKSVKSISDYEYIVKQIQNCIEPLAKKGNYKWYFRGDGIQTPAKCHLFREEKIEQEASMFKEWQEKCDCEVHGSFECLARMQHHKANTRLLDFSTDPMVALRFACGNEHTTGDRIVTVYCAEELDFENPNESATKVKEAFMHLVKSEDLRDFSTEERKLLIGDYFVKCLQGFERIKRQHGVFLLMGNCTIEDDCRAESLTKVEHDLSQTDGRGKNYRGFVGVIKIDGNFIEELRKQIDDEYAEYNMRYLLCEEEEDEVNNK